MCCRVKLLLHGLLSMCHSPCLQPAPVWALHGLQHFQGISTRCSMGSSVGCNADVCSGMVLSMDYWQIPAPPWLSSGATAPTIPAAAPRAPLLSPSSMTLDTAWLFLTLLSPSLLTLLSSVFYSFLNTFLQRCHHLEWETQFSPAVGWLDLTQKGCFQHGAAPDLFSWRPLLQTPF